MIGTAAIPITALSAKLINMNRNSSVTIGQPPLPPPPSGLAEAHPARPTAFLNFDAGQTESLDTHESPHCSIDGTHGYQSMELIRTKAR